MSTWIVTGGAGFIGCNFVRLALQRADLRVVVVDRLTYAGSLRNLEDVRDDPRFTFIQADIANRDAMGVVMREHRPTAVLNFAAESHVDRSIDGPGAFVHTNLVGTFELLDAAREYLDSLPGSERERFRFLHVSTDEVYGTLGDEGLFSEQTPYAPNSPYAATKAGADHLVRAYFHTFDVPTLITNCSNNFGPFQYPEKLIPLMVMNALDGRPLPIYGDGGNVRDWLFVEDHCSGILRVLEQGHPGEKYNLGARAERSNLELVDALCRHLETIAPAAQNRALREAGATQYGDLKTFVEDRPGHDRRYAIDPSRCEEELGWSPQHPFDEALGRTVRWYAENREWARAVEDGGRARERAGLARPKAVGDRKA